jgi:hypothetical protein
VFRISTAAVLAAAIACAPAKDQRATPSQPAAPPIAPEAAPAPPGEAVDPRCDLAQGSDSRIESPFVAVIRDQAIYETLLGKIHPKVPPLEERFLPAGLVVAAFLGPRPTPGYQAVIRREGNAFRIEERGPAPDAILAQVLTTPFAIAAFPAAPDDPVLLDPGPTIDRSLMRLAVDSGTLAVSGGIAGTSQTWKLSGTVRASSLDPLVTLLLDLRAASERETKEWKGALTLALGRAGAFEGLLWDASPLVPPPCKALALQGTFDSALGKLALRFAPGPCKAADSFGGTGELTATQGAKPPSN